MAQIICALCGEPMPAGEEMFKYHGYSGPCPVPRHTSKPVRLPAPVPFPDAMDQFRRIIRMNDPLNIDPMRPVRDVLPGLWPTYGDLTRAVQNYDAERAAHGGQPDLRKALLACRQIIADLPVDVLGTNGQGAEDKWETWPIRDEVLANIDAVLERTKDKTP